MVSHSLVIALLGSMVALISARTENCMAGFKVYVYDLPRQLIQRGIDARTNKAYHVCRKCIFEQFSLEFIIYDYFTQFCGRTHNPNEADYFYLPILRDLDYREALQKGDRAPSAVDQALINALEKQDFSLWSQTFNVTANFFKRHNGADHIVVMPAPVTNFRHQTNMRGFFHYMPQLFPPIFLSVETSRSFVTEYPRCSRKNLVLPYPLTDSDLFSFAYHRQYFVEDKSASPNSPQPLPTDVDPSIQRLLFQNRRDKLMFYHGGMHGSCIFVRLALNHLTRGLPDSIQRGDRKREEGFLRSVFCPIPVGDSPSSKRMFDALSLGCIPVLLSDDVFWPLAPYGRDDPSDLYIDPWRYSIQLPQSIVYASATYLLTAQRSILRSFEPHSAQGRAVYRAVLDELAKVAEEERQRATPILHPLDRNVSVELDKRGRPKPRFNPSTFPSLLSPATENTLYKVLLRIPKEVTVQLQSFIRFGADNFLFYARDYKQQGIYRPADPLTANSTYPAGGATRQLEKWLRYRKQHLLSVAQGCAEELRQTHNYTSQYPCYA